MRIVIEDPKDGEEDEIIVKCRQLDDNLMQMIYGIKMSNNKVIGSINGRMFMLSPEDIYYFESVDNKVFIYSKDKIYESKMKLYEIESEFINTDLIRVSKSVILNLKKIGNITPAFNGRFEATLKNKEKIIISRQYVPALKSKLGL